MDSACLFIAWDRPSGGTNRQTYGALMSASIRALEDFKRKGFCESYEAVGLTPHGGDMNGFFLIKGERARLEQLRRSDEFERFSSNLEDELASYVVPGVTLEGLKQSAERNPTFFKR